MYIARRRLLNSPEPIHSSPFITARQNERKLSKKRRLQGAYDITSGNAGDKPCIILEIKLETENLVPTNNNPDPASNIYLIGKAIANITGGMVTFPDIPDDETPANATSGIQYDPEWEIPDECLDETQVSDAYWVMFYNAYYVYNLFFVLHHLSIT